MGHILRTGKDIIVVVGLMMSPVLVTNGLALVKHKIKKILNKFEG